MRLHLQGKNNMASEEITEKEIDNLLDVIEDIKPFLEKSLSEYQLEKLEKALEPFYDKETEED